MRPYKGLVVLLYYNGRPPARHYRASLQRVSRLAVLQRTPLPPDTIVRLYGGLLVSCGYPICEVIRPKCL